MNKLGNSEKDLEWGEEVRGIQMVLEAQAEPTEI